MRSKVNGTYQAKTFLSTVTFDAGLAHISNIQKLISACPDQHIYCLASCNLIKTSFGAVVTLYACRVMSSRSSLTILSYLCMILTITYPASVRANCCPRQILGPPLNGRNSHPGFLPTQRSGLNSSASGPQMSFRRCIACTT
jgi:hypothetical protein